MTDVLTADEADICRPFRGNTRFAAEASLVAIIDRLQTPCVWEEDTDGTWSSGCGEVSQFNDDGPEENNVRFCHGCGHPVELRHYQEPEEDDRELDD
jgi:hypothetical protein